MTESSAFFYWMVPLLLLLLLVLLIRYVQHRRRYRRESEKIRQLQAKVQQALRDAPRPADTSFDASMARQTTRLQEPQLKMQSDMIKDAPEKYKILTNMAARGMSAEEIASILGISTTEAGQMVTLSSMAGWNS